MENQTSVPPLSFGQKAVGLTFNPSKDDSVNCAKEKCAELIDLLNDLRVLTPNIDHKAL